MKETFVKGIEFERSYMLENFQMTQQIKIFNILKVKDVNVIKSLNCYSHEHNYKSCSCLENFIYVAKREKNINELSFDEVSID